MGFRERMSEKEFYSNGNKNKIIEKEKKERERLVVVRKGSKDSNANANVLFCVLRRGRVKQTTLSQSNPLAHYFCVLFK